MNYGYPGAPQSGGYQQSQQPGPYGQQPQQGYAQQSQGYPQQPPQGYAAQQPMAAPPAPTTAWTMPDEQIVEAGYQRAAEIAAEAARARSGGGGGMKFVRMPGPQGQPKWDAGVPVGYESRVALYLAPAWASGRNYYIEGVTHFWKSYQHPQGTSIGCPGKDTCLIDKARGALFQSGREVDAAKARSMLRAQKHFYYQGFLLDLGPQQHVDPQGVLRPFVLDAGTDLHAKIQFIMKNRGFQNVIHPDGGRPLIVVKKKTGVEALNVDWDAIDGNPMPLPQEYRQAQLWDLSKLITSATPEEQVKALQECGMPIPPEALSLVQGGQPAGQQASYQGGYAGNPGYQPAAGQPPFANPYPQGGYGQPQQSVAPSFGMPQPGQAMLPYGQAAVPAMGAPPPPPPVVVPAAASQSIATYQPQPSQQGGYAQPPTLLPPPLMQSSPMMAPPPMQQPMTAPTMPPPPAMGVPTSRPQ